MKLPRDLSGRELVKLLSQYEYRLTRQTGSYLRLSSKIRGTEHHVTVPAHDSLKIGTLSAILSDVALYLKIDRNTLEQTLFRK